MPRPSWPEGRRRGRWKQEDVSYPFPHFGGVIVPTGTRCTAGAGPVIPLRIHLGQGQSGAFSFHDAAASTFAATESNAGTNASAIDPYASWKGQIRKTAPTLSKLGVAMAML
ncbi:protein of unknown function [Shinella sp. WSC3-e]|nr:protein of unknown function [Shinella sp. WSC3-e]